MYSHLKNPFPGVVLERLPFAHIYTGTAGALVAAGLVTLDQLPGQPGRPAHSVTYRDGEPATHRPGRGRPAGYMRIYRTRQGFRVYVAIPSEARLEQTVPVRPNEGGKSALCPAQTETNFSPQTEGVPDDEFRATAETLLFMTMRFVFDHSAPVQGYTPKPRHRQRFTDEDRNRLIYDLLAVHACLMAASLSVETAPPARVSRQRMDVAVERLLRSRKFRQNTDPE